MRYFRFSHCAAFIISSNGRGLSFSMCRCSPSPFFVDLVPFSAEHHQSFRNASSNACARKKKKKSFLCHWSWRHVLLINPSKCYSQEVRRTIFAHDHLSPSTWFSTFFGLNDSLIDTAESALLNVASLVLSYLATSCSGPFSENG